MTDTKFHCQRCCECVGCRHDAGAFYVEHPDIQMLSHTYGCKDAKDGEPVDPIDNCFYCAEAELNPREESK